MKEIGEIIVKIRTNFVSNSSSSSFIAIGVDDPKIVKKLIDAIERIDERNSNSKLSDYFSHDYNGYAYCGMSVEKLLYKYTIPQACAYVAKEFRDKLNVDVHTDEVDYITGEVYS